MNFRVVFWVFICFISSVCLFVYLSVCLSVCLSIYLSYLSIHPVGLCGKGREGKVEGMVEGRFREGRGGEGERGRGGEGERRKKSLYER